MEDGIKEKYYWQQADKKVIKAATMRVEETEELVLGSSHYLAS